MTNHARIVGGVAVDVSDKPTEQFHPDVASQFVAVPDEVKNGWIKTGSTWAAPAPVEPVAPALVYPKVGPIHFQMMFTAQESAKANELRTADPILASFWKLVDDPRTDTVDMSLTSVQNAIEYTLTVVKAAGVVVDVPARKAAILSGVLA